MDARRRKRRRWPQGLASQRPGREAALRRRRDGFAAYDDRATGARTGSSRRSTIAMRAGMSLRQEQASGNWLAAPLALSRPTVRDYVTLLERMFLVEELPPWHGNRLSRLVETPKVHLGDSGLACALLGLDADALAADRATLGQLLETFVVQELRRLASRLAGRVDFLHYRDRDGAGVDVVLEHRTLREAPVPAPFGDLSAGHQPGSSSDPSGRPGWRPGLGSGEVPRGRRVCRPWPNGPPATWPPGGPRAVDEPSGQLHYSSRSRPARRSSGSCR